MEPNTIKPAAPAFYLNTKPIEWPVYVRMPVDGGEFAHYVFTGHFARLDKDQVKALEAENELEKLGDDATTEAREAAVLADNMRKMPRYLVGWSGVRSGPGADDEVLYSVDLLRDQLLGPNGTAFAIGVWHARREIEMGVRLGNFAPSPEPGPDGASAPDAPNATP